MAREDFLKDLDARDFKPEEIIDGVRIVHTGMKLYDYDTKGNPVRVEVLEMYDSNGNRFYSNCSSLEAAKQLVEDLKAEGKDAVIGPKAPAIDSNGKPIPNTMEGWVGVYIVKTIEEKEESKDGIEPAE